MTPMPGPDEALQVLQAPQALPVATAAAAQWLLAALDTPVQRHGEWLQHAGGFTAEVHLDCTALWPAVVLVSLLVLFGAQARVGVPRLVRAATWGVGVVALVNQMRLVGTVWLGVHAPAHWTLVHEVVGPLALVAAGAGVVVAMVKAPPSWARAASPGVGALAWVVAAFAFAGVATAAMASTASSSSSGASRPGRAAAPAVLPPIASGAAAAADPAGAAMISGDLIVKFRDASEPGRQLAAVLAGQRDTASAAPVASRLSADLGLPLVLVQVTSGGEALLALDRETLGRDLLARAGREAQVQRATMTVPPPGGGLPGAELVLRIELRPAAPAPAAQAMAARLALTRMPAPRVLDEAAGKALRLVYDIDALTLALIARLQQRSDVEYAQANRLLRPAAPAASR